MVRSIVSLFAACALAMALGGCSDALTALVGEKDGGQKYAKSKVPQPFSLSYASSGLEGTPPGLTGQTLLPPTVPAAQTTYATDESDTVGTAGPHPAIAVAELADDPAKLAPLGAAAAREGKSGARFILLVLTPPAADAAAINRLNTQSRTAAAAAVRAIADAGVAADRVEVSAATNPGVGAGELRLYVR